MEYTISDFRKDFPYVGLQLWIFWFLAAFVIRKIAAKK